MCKHLQSARRLKWIYSYSGEGTDSLAPARAVIFMSHHFPWVRRCVRPCRSVPRSFHLGLACGVGGRGALWVRAPGGGGRTVFPVPLACGIAGGKGRMEGGDARPVEAAAGGIEEGIPPVAEPSMVSGDRATERQSERARAQRPPRSRRSPLESLAARPVLTVCAGRAPARSHPTTRRT